MNRNEQLDFIIKELSPSTRLPETAERKWQTFRTLVNKREPQPVSTDFLKAQDRLLKEIIQQKGITDISDLQPIKGNLYLWRGDITTLKVDAIVNAANSGMLGCFVPCHACIDNSIHTYAGVQLRLECAAIMEKQGHPEPTGHAKITAAYNLPSKYILHTVGPIVTGRVRDSDRRLLESCYRSCLELAEKNEVESIAFCCISTGEFRFPNGDAAKVAIDVVSDYMKSSRLIKRVIFDVFTERDEYIYKRLLG